MGECTSILSSHAEVELSLPGIDWVKNEINIHLLRFCKKQVKNVDIYLVFGTLVETSQSGMADHPDLHVRINFKLMHSLHVNAPIRCFSIPPTVLTIISIAGVGSLAWRKVVTAWNLIPGQHQQTGGGGCEAQDQGVQLVRTHNWFLGNLPVFSGLRKLRARPFTSTYASILQTRTPSKI